MYDQKDLKLDEETLKRLNKEAIESQLVLSDNIYVDLRLFKDFTVGTLIRLIVLGHPDLQLRNHEGYEYILDKLSEYEIRSFDDPLYCFPKLNIPLNTVEALLKDPLHADMIFITSPLTNFLQTFLADIAVNVNHSQMMGKKDEIKVFVNTYPLKLSKKASFIVGKFFSTGLGLTIEVDYKDPLEMDAKYLLKFDDVYSYYFKEISTIDDIRKAYSEMRFANKRLYIPQLYREEFNSERDVKKEIMKTFSVFNILCQFKYINVKLISPKTDISQTAAESS